MSEGFFRFPWGGGTWLGYGLSDGRVTGTYCPAHRAERDARADEPQEGGATEAVRTTEAVGATATPEGPAPSGRLRSSRCPRLPAASPVPTMAQAARR